MDRIKAALTSKIGPLPGWAWAGAAVLGALVVVPRLAGMFGSSSSPAPADGSSADATSSGPGAPGTAPAGPPAPAPGPAPAPAAAPPKAKPAYKTHVVVHGDTLWGIAQQYLGNGARWPEIWALSHFRSGNPNLIYPGEIAVLPIPVGGPGIGGAPIGSRRSELMTYFHPDLTRKIRYPQTIAVGGPASSHAGNVRRVAAQAGVHPARVLALNPHHRGLIRVA